MNRIKQLREKTGLQQKELAAALGVTQPTISDWEAGKKAPSSKSAAALADFFHVSIDYLLARTVSANVPGSAEDARRIEALMRDDGLDEVWQLREALRRDPDRRVLFNAAKNVRPEDILTAVRILDALKESNHEYRSRDDD